MKFFNTDDLVAMRLTGERPIDRHSPMLTLHPSPQSLPIVGYGESAPLLNLCLSYTTSRVTDDVVVVVLHN